MLTGNNGEFLDTDAFTTLCKTKSATIEIHTKHTSLLKNALEAKGFDVKEECKTIWQISKTERV